MMRGCIIISTEYTTISHVINNGGTYMIIQYNYVAEF